MSSTNSKKPIKEVSKVAIFYKGKLLMGIRQDSGKWTEPGGGLNPGESPLKGAIREVKEEAGINLSPEEMTHLGSKEVVSGRGENLIIHTFRADLKKEPHTSADKDPDKEVFGWNFVELKNGKLPLTIAKNLHVPVKKNVLHFFLGFEKNAMLHRLVPSKKIMVFIGDLPNQAAQNYPAEFRKKESK